MYKQHCNIGIVGRGFVGSAVEYGFSDKRKYLLFINDKDESKSVHSLEDVVVYSDFIFLSVPTPSNSDGSIDLSYVETALQENIEKQKQDDDWEDTESYDIEQVEKETF